RADRRDDVAAAREPVSASRSRLQQLAKIADTHSRSRHRDAEGIACTGKDWCAITLPVQREEEERTIAAAPYRRTTFAKVRQENWTTNRAIEVVRYVVWYRL